MSGIVRELTDDDGLFFRHLVRRSSIEVASSRDSGSLFDWHEENQAHYWRLAFVCVLKKIVSRRERLEAKWA